MSTEHPVWRDVGDVKIAGVELTKENFYVGAGVFACLSSVLSVVVSTVFLAGIHLKAEQKDKLVEVETLRHWKHLPALLGCTAIFFFVSCAATTAYGVIDNTTLKRNIEISTYFAIAIAGILVLRLGWCNGIGCGVYNFVQKVTCWKCAISKTVIHGTIIRNCQSFRKGRNKVEYGNPAKAIRATAIIIKA